METPILKTKRLLLRPFCEGDTVNVFNGWESDPEVAKYMFRCSHNDLEKTKEWITFEMNQIPSDHWYRWTVVLAESGELIGTGLIYYEEEYNLFEVSYNFNRQYWGHGYATETMKAILDFAKNTLELKVIVARVAKANKASKGVLTKLGFSFVKEIVFKANEGCVSYEGVECRLKLE